MIQLDRITKSYGGRTLFSDLSWQLHPGRRIGLVGPNGAGKTTLFRILTGETSPDQGRVVRPSGASIGLLPQDVGELGDEPAIAQVLRGRQDLLDLESECMAIEEALPQLVEEGAHARIAERSARLAELRDDLHRKGGPQLRSRAASILAGMGFSDEEMTLPCNTFSGGRRVRIVLSRLLLQRPTVLLMDEPTNHLDVPSIEWLEGFLGDYEGTVVVISHDRYFLNRLVNEVAGLEPEGLFVHPGTWDDYQRAREERATLLRARAEAQQREIAETERFIERFRAKATKARQVQSRVKALEKVERLELREEGRDIRFRFPEAERSGRVVVHAEGLAHRYGERPVFDPTDFVVERGERVALVGPNGAGKSTLLRILAGDLHPSAGRVQLGHNVEIAYFAQHSVEALHPERTILEEMEAAATHETFPLCRGILGAFLFSGDDAGKRISVLSGGERNRVALARMLLRPANFLLLDEPTNHLDMSSRDVLEEALRSFGGTVVFVSHDRHFINAVATRVVHVEHRSVRSYPGDYEYYRFKHGTAKAETKGTTSSAGTDSTEGAGAAEGRLSRKERRRREAELRNAHRAASGALRSRVEALEARCQELEEAIGAIEEALADPATYQEDPSAAAVLGTALAGHRRELETCMEAWSEGAEALEEMDTAHEEALQALSEGQP